MKTLGEIARQAWMDCESSDYWEVTASAVRKAVLEEAIEAAKKEAEELNQKCLDADDEELSGYYDDVADGARTVVIALQHLLDKYVSCNQQAQVDQSVSAPGEPLQSDNHREAEG